MTVHRIEPYLPFKSRAITSQCTKMWRKLFAVIRQANVSPEWGDIALWVTHADSAGIRLRLRSSSEDDEDPAWDSPPLIATGAEGLCEALDASSGPRELKSIKDEFYAWVNPSIVKSFKSAAIQKLYRAYNPDDKPFSIFVAKHDRSFSESSLETLWTNQKGPVPERMKEKQAAERTAKKYKAVRKKTPAELRAMRKKAIAKKK